MASLAKLQQFRSQPKDALVAAEEGRRILRATHSGAGRVLAELEQVISEASLELSDMQRQHRALGVIPGA